MTPRDDIRKKPPRPPSPPAVEKETAKGGKHPSDLAAEIEEAWRFANAKPPSRPRLRRRARKEGRLP